MDLNWSRLRTLNGSQADAYEELVCQLASQEDVLPGSVFNRKGRPDAGVECYWTETDGSERGWQAKFFREPLGPTQWAQIDKSVRKAIEKHPSLTEYVVSIPQDQADGRMAGRKSFKDRWNEHCEKWQNWAKQTKRSVSFTFWGTHQILTRLSEPRNAGKCRFWFDRDLFSAAWHAQHIEGQIANAGPRYTPAVHVELPLAGVFDWLVRSDAAVHKLIVAFGGLKQEWQSCARSLERMESPIEFSALASLLEQLLTHRAALPVDPALPLCLPEINGLVERVEEQVDAVHELVQEHPDAIGYKEARQAYDPLAGHKYRHELRALDELKSKLYQLARFMIGRDANVTDQPCLLILGTAGSGKTHLLCDISRNRMEQGLPTVLLLGEQFIDKPPWPQIFEITELTCDLSDEFLGALDSAAQSCGERALICIDALNENMGRSLWRKHLQGLLRDVVRYPRVAIAISIRHGYEESILGDDQERWPINVWHSGFDEVLDDACAQYFRHFKIQAPTIPLLHPEFANPLFLKTFCQAIRNAGLSAIPAGTEGISAIMDLFIRGLRTALWGDSYADIDPNSTKIRACVDGIAMAIAKSDNDWITVADAEQIVGTHLGSSSAAQLLGVLVSEGLVARDMFYSESHNRIEGIRFGYERFADHWIARHLLDEHCDPDDVSGSFAPGTRLGNMIRVVDDHWMPQGPLEALAVQIPERHGMEVLELLSSDEWSQHHIQAFLDSLIWRKASAVTQFALELVQKNLKRTEPSVVEQLLPILIHVAARVDHPLNADVLHGFLSRLTLSERDWLWSLAIHENWEQSGPVARLVRWAWDRRAEDRLDDAVVVLAGTALAWMLTSSNRYLRDRSTKALVSLCCDRPGAMHSLLKKFCGIYDPYVVERVFAAAYACVLRSSSPDCWIDMAKWVANLLMDSERLPPHVLLRDYARGIVVASGLAIEHHGLKPPFHSEWPRGIASVDELRPFFDRDSDKQLGKEAVQILYSVTQWGDWSRYVVRTSAWSTQRYTSPDQVAFLEQAQARVARYCDELTARQSVHFETYRKAFETDYRKSSGEQEQPAPRARLLRSMGTKKRSEFEEQIVPLLYAIEARGFYWKEPEFPQNLMERFVLAWVKESGWNGEWFDEFDQTVGRHYMRDDHKPERIGKKYQWLAYHEAHARLSDSFYYLGNEENGHEYCGPWQVGARDIDPTILLRKTNDPEWEFVEDNWWNPVSTRQLESDSSDGEWLRSNSGLPVAGKIIEPTDATGEVWFALESYAHVEHPHPPGEERSSEERRRMWWMIDAYLIDVGDIAKIAEWASHRKVSYFHRWSGNLPWEMFYGEYPSQLHWFGVDADEIERAESGLDKADLPVPHRRTSLQYLRENAGYDCSQDGPVSIRVPSPSLITGLNLDGRSMDGQWVDPNGNQIAFDPSVYESGPSSLLARRDVTLAWLLESGLTLAWLVRGEKGMIGGGFGQREWLGRYLFQGAFVLANGKLEGTMRTWFHEPC